LWTSTPSPYTTHFRSRAQEVDRHLAPVDALGDLPGAEGLDRRQQRLAQPDVGRGLRDRVAAELPAGGGDRGEHDRGPDQAEDGRSEEHTSERQSRFDN